MDEERLIAIETQLAHQEDLLGKLNGALSDQQRQLIQLETLTRSLLERVRSLPEGATVEQNPADERPPHY